MFYKRGLQMKKKGLIIIISLLLCLIVLTTTACEEDSILSDGALFTEGAFGEKKVYDINSSNFCLEGFQKQVSTGISTKPGIAPTTTLQVEVYVTCVYDIVEYSGDIVLLDANGQELQKNHCAKSKEFDAYDVICETVEVTNDTYNKINDIKINFSAKTYQKNVVPKNSSERKKINIFYKYNAKEVYKYVTIDKNSTIDEPSREPSISGKAFSHWSLYTNGTAYTFNKVISQDLILYAVFKSNYTVKFIVDDSIYETKTVVSGECVSKPKNPTKSNYSFTGWYVDSTLKNEFSFSNGIVDNKVLYAGFKIDAATLTNTITTSTMRSMVTVYNKSYNTFLGIPTESVTGQGSGVIFNKSSNYYYLLTNCHVAVLKDGYKKQNITVVDYQGNEYEGKIYNNGTYDSIAASYDLACIYFKSTNSNLRTISFGSVADAGDDVISLGAPKGQSNAITFGKVIDDVKIKLDTETYRSNVTFAVHKHDALIDNGSSGGALLDSNLRLVGINYAGKKVNGFTTGYAIPINKVREFLNKYVY